MFKPSESLRDKIVNNSIHGICDAINLADNYIEILDKMEEILIEKGWYSGRERYPIAHPYDIEPEFAYHEKHKVWNHDCEYCQRRIQVAEELIEWLESDGDIYNS